MKMTELLEAEFTAVNPITGERRTFKSTRSKEYRQWQQEIERQRASRQGSLDLPRVEPQPKTQPTPTPPSPTSALPREQPQSQPAPTPQVNTDTSTGGGTWALRVGKQLYDPYHPEYQAKVERVENINLADPQQANYLRGRYSEMGGNVYDQFVRQNAGAERTPELSQLRKQAIEDTRIMSLNTPRKTGYAHVIYLSVYRQNTPMGKLAYVYYDDRPTKSWVMDPKPDARQEQRLTANRLPVNVTAIGRRGAGSYWQPLAAHHATAQARDRLEPTNISGIAQRDKDLSQINLEIDQQNRRLIRALENPDRISVGNIGNIIQSSRARRNDINAMRSAFPQIKRQYLADLLDVFIKNPGKSGEIYPLVLIDNTAPEKMLAKTGIESTSSITTDFFEIIHPIAIVSGNARGNAQRMILEFLDADNYEQLMKRALISYGAQGNTPLVDSYIYSRGRDGIIRKLQLSSKSGVGRAASLSSLGTALDEIKNNSIASKMFDELDQNPKFKSTIDFIDKLVQGSRNNTPKAQSAFELAESMDIATESDLKLGNKLLSYYKNRGGRLDEPEQGDSEESTREMGFTIPPEIFNQFSTGIKQAYQSAKENSNQLKQLINGLWLIMADRINSTPQFSQLVTWIFNHSATVQVNTHVDKEGDKLILSNVTATWPSQTVDNAELVATGGENINFSISVNGYKAKFGNIPSSLGDRTGTAGRDSTDNITTWKDYPGAGSMDTRNTGQLRQLKPRQANIDDTISRYSDSGKRWQSMIVAAKNSGSELWQLWRQIENKSDELPEILRIIGDGGSNQDVIDYIQKIL